jgi:hypothetical protein
VDRNRGHLNTNRPRLTTHHRDLRSTNLTMASGLCRGSMDCHVSSSIRPECVYRNQTLNPSGRLVSPHKSYLHTSRTDSERRRRRCHCESLFRPCYSRCGGHGGLNLRYRFVWPLAVQFLHLCRLLARCRHLRNRHH